MIAAVIGTSSPGWTQKLSLNGSLSAKGIAFDAAPEHPAGFEALLGLNVDMHITEYSSGEVRMLLRDNTGSEAKLAVFSSERSINTDAFELDRANVALDLNRFRIVAGKQRIGWGTAYMINPTDSFNPSDLNLPPGDKRGVNALLVDIYLNPVTYLTLLTAQDTDLEIQRWILTRSFGDIFASSTAEDFKHGARFKTTLLGVDFGLSAVYLGHAEHYANRYGAEFSSSLGDFGVFGEGAWTTKRARAFHDYYEAVGGLDYSHDDLFLVAEFFYNGIGEGNKADYDLYETLKTGRLLMGSRYALGGARYHPTELLTLGLHGLYNINDQSSLVNPRVILDVYENTQVILEAVFFLAETESEFRQPTPEAIKDLFAVDYFYNNAYWAKFKVDF